MRAMQTPPLESAVELKVTAKALERRLSSELQAYEARYELRSKDLEKALRVGEIRETAEIVDWLITYRTLLGLQDEIQARPE
jgi:hypothetical protein